MQLAVWDVFLLDSDFVIERPKRYYRQGLKLLHHDGHSQDEDDERHFADEHETDIRQTQSENDAMSRFGTIKKSLRRTFTRKRKPRLMINGHAAGHADDDDSSSSDSSSDSDSDSDHHPPTPLLDPSTNTNPLQGTSNEDQEEGGKAWQAEKKKRGDDVSKHTFFIQNSQMRLKLYAKNQVCGFTIFRYASQSLTFVFQRQMLQWITALERVAGSSHFTGKNRFDSFAPIRLNVAAQWLVDGVGCCNGTVNERE